jgi:hypothetical protein
VGRRIVWSGSFFASFLRGSASSSSAMGTRPTTQSRAGILVCASTASRTRGDGRVARPAQKRPAHGTARCSPPTCCTH